MKQEEIRTGNAPAAIGPYSQAVKANGLLFVSGQIPVDGKTGTMPKGVRQQTVQCLTNIEAVLAAAELTMRDVVKCTIYLADLAAFGEANEVYSSFFEEPYPARACVEVSALPKGALVEIEAVAVVKA